MRGFYLRFHLENPQGDVILTEPEPMDIDVRVNPPMNRVGFQIHARVSLANWAGWSVVGWDISCLPDEDDGQLADHEIIVDRHRGPSRVAVPDSDVGFRVERTLWCRLPEIVLEKRDVHPDLKDLDP